MAKTATKEMPVKDYAALRGVTAEGVRIAIARKTKLPGVKSYKKFGRDWVLTVDLSKIEK